MGIESNQNHNGMSDRRCRYIKVDSQIHCKDYFLGFHPSEVSMDQQSSQWKGLTFDRHRVFHNLDCW